MRFPEIPMTPSRKNLRLFAAAWLVLFIALSWKHYFKQGHPAAGITFLCLALFAGIPGLLYPPAIRWLFVGATIVTFPIGWVVSQVMLGILYFCILTPAAILLRIKGRDLLGKKRAERPSFWTPKGMPNDVRSYFRQY